MTTTTSTLQEIITNLNYQPINVCSKQNWNGFDYISYLNLFLAELFNKLSSFNKDIKIINSISDNPEFFKFIENPSTYIISTITIDPETYHYISTFNGKVGNVYVISSITINDHTYIASEENNGIIDLGNYLPKSEATSIVNTFNNITGDVSGVQYFNINNNIINEFMKDDAGNVIIGHFNLGDWVTADKKIVYSINGVSGDIKAIIGINVNGIIFKAVKNNYNINVKNDIYRYIDINISPYILKNKNDMLMGYPTADTPPNEDRSNRIANLLFISNIERLNFLIAALINIEEGNYIYDSVKGEYTYILTSFLENSQYFFDYIGIFNNDNKLYNISNKDIINIYSSIEYGLKFTCKNKLLGKIKYLYRPIS